MSAISGEEDLKPPETGNEAQSVVTRAYLNKDTYFYNHPRPLPQHTKCYNPEPWLLSPRTTVDLLNAPEARSVMRIDAVVEDFLTDKGKGQRGESGNYRQDAGREFSRFVDFLADALTESDDTHWIFAIIP